MSLMRPRKTYICQLTWACRVSKSGLISAVVFSSFENSLSMKLEECAVSKQSEVCVLLIGLFVRLFICFLRFAWDLAEDWPGIKSKFPNWVPGLRLQRVQKIWPKIILKISENYQIEVVGPKFLNALYCRGWCVVLRYHRFWSSFAIGVIEICVRHNLNFDWVLA